MALVEAGVTAMADASVEPALLDRYREYADDFVIDVGLYLNRIDFCGEDEGTWYEAYPPGTQFSDRLRVAGVKIFSDGGACNLLASSEPFIEGFPIGPPYFSPDVLTDFVRTASDSGYQILIHAQGDLAIKDAQDALAEVIQGADNVLRHRIDHNSIVTPELAGRYSDIGIVPVVFGFNPTCRDTAWTEFWKGAGENWRQLWDANPDLPIAWHGDDPGAPPLDPLLDLASFVTRVEIADDGTICEPEPWLADKAITVDQALAMMTRNSAYAIGLDHEVGTLAPGKRADFVVISADPTAVASIELFDLKLLATYLGGRAAFCASEAVCVLRMELPSSASTSDAPSIAGLSASESREAHSPALAFDGLATGESFWSSGGDTPQWIQLSFDEPRPIESLRFIVFQNPASETVHELEFLNEGEWQLAERYEGFTTTGDLIEWLATPGSPTIVDGFRMTTLTSESWPEWFEIEVEPPWADCFRWYGRQMLDIRQLRAEPDLVKAAIARRGEGTSRARRGDLA